MLPTFFYWLERVDGWFEFWAGLLLVLGISMIARFTVYLVAVYLQEDNLKKLNMKFDFSCEGITFKYSLTMV